MKKTEINKLCKDLAKIKIPNTGDSWKDWLIISQEVAKDKDLVKRLKQTNPKELADKGYMGFAFSYNLICQTFQEHKSITEVK